MDGFELLRRAKDLAVGLGDAFSVHNVKLDSLFCRFNETTGWPVYSMKEDGGPVRDGICKIDETAARGISVRQLRLMYEHVKRRCVAEGWTNWAGELVTPETVTKKLERGATYWVCHRCGDRHKPCSACAPAHARRHRLP